MGRRRLASGVSRRSRRSRRSRALSSADECSLASSVAALSRYVSDSARPERLKPEQNRAARPQIAVATSLSARKRWRLHVEISEINRAVLAFRSGVVRNITDSRRCRRQRRETPQGNANTTAPETISVAPIAPRGLKRSPRNVIESNIAATTLSLSIGATLVTSPICSARK